MALGRGLNSLIPPRNSSANILNSAKTSELVHAQDDVVAVAVTAIVPNPHQPRRHFSHQQLEELINSITAYGILQPLLVSSLGDGEYELIAGERRLRAARIAGLATVPVLVRDVSELEKLELALIENIQRSDLNPMERAESYRKLINEFGLNHDEAAKKLGISRSSFSNILRLLDLPGDVQRALADGQITEGHAKILLGLPTEKDQLARFQDIISERLSVRALATQLQGKTKQRHVIKRSTIPAHISAWEDDLMTALGTKVKIQQHGDSGTIQIHYYSAEELGDLVARLQKRGK